MLFKLKIIPLGCRSCLEVTKDKQKKLADGKQHSVGHSDAF